MKPYNLIGNNSSAYLSKYERGRGMTKRRTVTESDPITQFYATKSPIKFHVNITLERSKIVMQQCTCNNLPNEMDQNKMK